MATIECILKVGPKRELMATNTREMEKLSKLKPGDEVRVKISSGETGPMTMLNLWMSWMGTTGEYMAAQGCVMPLMLREDGTHYGQRKFSKADAHDLFTVRWLGNDAKGNRLSWSRKGTDDSRPADKGERFLALQRHEEWAINRGIKLLNPRDSEYRRLDLEQNQ